MEARKALFKGKDYITTEECSEAEIEMLLDVSADLKRKFKGRVPHRYLADQTIFLMFFDKSTRTRNSFEAGMTQLGGHAHFLTADVMQVSHGESPKDTGIILSSYGHGIAIRHDLVPGEGNAYMREVAKLGGCAGDQYAVRRRPSLPDAGRPDDYPREARTQPARTASSPVSWAYAPSYAKPLSRAARR